MAAIMMTTTAMLLMRYVFQLESRHAHVLQVNRRTDTYIQPKARKQETLALHCSIRAPTSVELEMRLRQTKRYA